MKKVEAKRNEFGVLVKLNHEFSVIRETLSRMGIVNKEKKIITPTCYIYQDGDDHFICHFKELLAAFDDVPDVLIEKDKDRRNSICTMLENWGLIEIIDSGVYQEGVKEKIFILPYNDKKKYTVNNKFSSFDKLAELKYVN